MNISSILALAEKFKGKASLITTSISTIAAIGGAVIYVETNYAHAADVKEILTTQQTMVKNQERSQRSQIMFQLEYYDDRLKRLAQELDTKSNNPTAKGQRSLTDINSDISDVKLRREMARKSLTE